MAARRLHGILVMLCCVWTIRVHVLQRNTRLPLSILTLLWLPLLLTTGHGLGVKTSPKHSLSLSEESPMAVFIAVAGLVLILAGLYLILPPLVLVIAGIACLRLAQVVSPTKTEVS